MGSNVCQNKFRPVFPLIDYESYSVLTLEYIWMELAHLIRICIRRRRLGSHWMTLE
jgi:hypothetical protein